MKNCICMSVSFLTHFILVGCLAHNDCPTDLPFCDWDGIGNCDVCEECHYCSYGIDGTCGPCGAGFPTKEEGSCKNDEGICFSLKLIGIQITFYLNNEISFDLHIHYVFKLFPYRTND